VNQGLPVADRRRAGKATGSPIGVPTGAPADLPAGAPAGVVFDIKKFSIHDGPGIRTTVFFKGCPLACRWCHNPESQTPRPERIFRENRCLRCGACLTACEHGAISLDGDVPVTNNEKCTLCGACVEVCYAEAREIVGREMTVVEAMAEVERDVVFYDESGGGVTVSGGEPLMQPEFLLALLRACREQKIHTALDTCGFAPWQTLDRIRPHVDLFLYDLKLMDDGRHRHLTGVPNEIILSNLRALSQKGHNIILRVPIIPGLNDDEENIRQIGAFAAALPHLDGVDLLPYHRAATDKYERLHKDYTLSAIRPPSEERLAEVARILQAAGLRVKIGG
jgi:pyruvate formate lyase activating enzyme